MHEFTINTWKYLKHNEKNKDTWHKIRVHVKFKGTWHQNRVELKWHLVQNYSIIKRQCLDTIIFFFKYVEVIYCD